MDRLGGIVYDWIWQESFWFPAHISWKDFENKHSDVYIPETRELAYVLPVAAALSAVRLLFERFVARPLGELCGLSSAQPPKAAHSEPLERCYATSKHLHHDDVKALSEQTGMSERQLQRWYRRRRNQERPSAMKKFTETAWRFAYYLVIFIYGIYVLWDKPWLTDTRQCWYNYPVQSVTRDLYWYYMIELAFYVCLFFSQFSDVKRKDFWEQFIHHVATIFLMWFSWSNNFVRMGSLVLCTHDAADCWLEGAKLAKYSKRSALCDKLFACFAAVWLLSRLIYYPCFIVWSTMFEAVAVIGYAPAVYFYNFFLVTLLILNVFWFYLIAKISYRALMTGQVDKDVRSASEESEDVAACPAAAAAAEGDGKNRRRPEIGSGGSSSAVKARNGNGIAANGGSSVGHGPRARANWVAATQ